MSADQSPQVTQGRTADVYLLHLDSPAEDGRTYVGWTSGLGERLARHAEVPAEIDLAEASEPEAEP